ncbi:MAG: PQQ-dependent sugar dehydrogenase, partial [Microbacteriaceae bacterium]|nr:PQQ-dependent sugar dehydrogenase [Microbacteriaceae bacterium]
MHRSRSSIIIAALSAALVTTGCTGPERVPTAVGTPEPAPPSTPSATEALVVPLVPTGELEPLVTGLSAPWSIAPLPTGSILLSE